MRRPRADEHEDFYRTSLGKEVLDAEVELLLDLLPEEGRVLSIGCGIGVHEAALRERRPAMELTCSDLQDEMLRSAPADLHLVRADMTDLPFPDGTYDAVYEITALVFVDDPEKALFEMARVIRPGGSLVLLTLNPLSKWGRDRLGELPAPWGELEGLVAMVEAATGGVVNVDHALNLEDDVLQESTGLEDAALLILTSKVARV
jgi:SAM-dependent methyltransferase